MKGRTKQFLAFIAYATFISIYWSLPEMLEIILDIIRIIVLMISTLIFFNNLFTLIISGKYEIKKEFKKIIKEIFLFIPIWILSYLIKCLLNFGESSNQLRIIENFTQFPIGAFLSAVIMAPICEEMIFRYLPHIFIKNKLLYVIISSTLFAGMHVLDSPLHFIITYLIVPLYWAYRYSKTEDIFIPISLHSFSNLIASIFVLIDVF